MIDFPASPTVGQRFTAAGATWIFDGVKWLPEGLAPTVVPGINDNRIINGDMRIDQRNNGAVTTPTVNGTYVVDRWQASFAQPSRISFGRNNASPTVIGFGFANFLSIQTVASYTPASNEFFTLRQQIEGDMLTDFQWGTPNAQPITLSFIANCSLAGTFSGTIRNNGGARAYPFTFSLTPTWTKFVINIPPDTDSSWVASMSGNAAGLLLTFDLGAGATTRGPAGAWASVNYVGATGSQSLVSTNGAIFNLTGVKLEIGSVATPFNRQSLAKSMADCQRYYEKLGGANPADIDIEGYAVGASSHVTQTIGISAMRAVPTAVVVGTFTGGNFSSVAVYGGLSTVAVQIISTAAGLVSWYSGGATAYLTLNAEL